MRECIKEKDEYDVGQGSMEAKRLAEKPSGFKYDASAASFMFMDYPLSDKLLTIIYCKKCGTVQGIAARER